MAACRLVSPSCPNESAVRCGSGPPLQGSEAKGLACGGYLRWGLPAAGERLLNGFVALVESSPTFKVEDLRPKIPLKSFDIFVSEERCSEV